MDDVFVPIRGEALVSYLLVNPIALLASPLVLLAIFIGPVAPPDHYIFWDSFDD